MYRSAIGKLRGWLLPEKEEDEEPRRAPRGLEPEVIVHYWDGSVPDARHVRDISDSGAYIYTPERWYLGTIIRILLQGYPKSIREDGTTVPTSSICIPARVVRHGTDGIAVEFIFQDEEEEQRFQKFLAAIPAQPPRTQRPKETSQRKGQALVEFALFIPLVFLLAVTGVTFGGYLFPCSTVATAVRGAPRCCRYLHEQPNRPDRCCSARRFAGDRTPSIQATDPLSNPQLASSSGGGTSPADGCCRVYGSLE